MNPWFRDSLTELQRSSRHADCKFIIVTPTGNKVYPCHKLIFSCASEVFDRMLYGNYNESTSGEVILTDVDPKVFEYFCDYVYSYDTVGLQLMDFDNLVKLLEFGSKYLVESIKDDCVRQLLCHRDLYDKNQLLRLFQCAHTVDSFMLIHEVGRELKNIARKMLSHTSIYQFSTHVFKSYLEVIEGSVFEADRFNMIEMYLKLHELEEANSEAGSEDAAVENVNEEAIEELNTVESEISDRKLIAELLHLIDFEKFTPKEFYQGPGKSKLFSLKQKYEYLYRIARNCPHAEQCDNYYLPSGCHTDDEVQRQCKARSHTHTHCHCKAFHECIDYAFNES